MSRGILSQFKAEVGKLQLAVASGSKYDARFWLRNKRGLFCGNGLKGGLEGKNILGWPQTFWNKQRKMPRRKKKPFPTLRDIIISHSWINGRLKKHLPLGTGKTQLGDTQGSWRQGEIYFGPDIRTFHKKSVAKIYVPVKDSFVSCVSVGSDVSSQGWLRGRSRVFRIFPSPVNPTASALE
jgi:hypothetical protein